MSGESRPVRSRIYGGNLVPAVSQLAGLIKQALQDLRAVLADTGLQNEVCVPANHIYTIKLDAPKPGKDLVCYRIWLDSPWRIEEMMGNKKASRCGFRDLDRIVSRGHEISLLDAAWAVYGLTGISLI